MAIYLVLSSGQQRKGHISHEEKTVLGFKVKAQIPSG